MPAIVKSKNAAGQEVGVMHACGHDVHVTTMIGTARVLAAMKSKWHGTVMLIGQPSEETIDGAKAMLADQLYERFGAPDLAIALHDTNTRAAGTVSLASGPALAGSTSVDVLIRGIGGHGAQPQVDQGSHRHGGRVHRAAANHRQPPGKSPRSVGRDHRRHPRRHQTQHHSLRSRDGSHRPHLQRQGRGKSSSMDIRRTAQGVALSAGIPDDLAPIVTVLDAESTPVTYNDPALAAGVKARSSIRWAQTMYSMTARPWRARTSASSGSAGHRIPTVMFGLGAMDPAKFAAAQAAGKSLPGPHTSLFQPSPEPTLRTGVTAMSSVAIALLQQ